MQRNWLIAFLVLVAMLIAAPITSWAGSDPPMVNNASNNSTWDQFALSPTDASTYKTADNANFDETSAWSSSHSDPLMAMITQANRWNNAKQVVLSTAHPNTNAADTNLGNSYAANANALNTLTAVTAQTTMETWMLTTLKAAQQYSRVDAAPVVTIPRA